MRQCLGIIIMFTSDYFLPVRLLKLMRTPLSSTIMSMPLLLPLLSLIISVLLGLFINYPNSWSSERPLGFLALASVSLRRRAAAWLVQEHACMIGRVVTRINFR